MKKTIWAIALAGAMGCGDKGPPGDPGTKGDPGQKGDKGDPGTTPASLASIQPNRAFLGRSVTVQIGGNNTHFGDQTRVEFSDPKIKVLRLQVASPTLLQATVQIGPTDPTMPATYAKVGPSDVTVTTAGGETPEGITLKQAFAVDSPLQVRIHTPDDKPGGTLVQGGVGLIDVLNLDYVGNPFVITPGGLFSPAKVNLQGGFLEHSSLLWQGGSGSAATAIALIDVKASKSPNFALVGPSPLGDVASYVLPAGIPMRSPEITARNSADLALGKDVMGKIDAKYGSVLYKLSGVAMGDQLLGMTFTTGMDAKISPLVFLLPESGRWADQLNVLGGAPLADMPTSLPYFTVTTGGKDLYAVVLDSHLGGGTGFDYTLSVKSKDLFQPMMYMAGTKPDMPNTQLDLSKGANYVKTAALLSKNDKNYFEFKAQATGRHYVITSAPNPAKDSTDLALDVLEGPCKTGMSVIGGPIDNDVYEQAFFDATMGKTYCVFVAMSRFGAATGGAYSVLVTPAL